MQELFDSFPVSAATRTLAHLTALAAALAFTRRDPFRPVAQAAPRPGNTSVRALIQTAAAPGTGVRIGAAARAAAIRSACSDGSKREGRERTGLWPPAPSRSGGLWATAPFGGSGRGQPG